MKDLGYESTNSLLNCETIGPMIMLLYVKVAFYFIILKPIMTYTKLKEVKILQKFFNQFLIVAFYSEFLNLILGGYLELLITAIINIKAPIMSPNGEIISLIFSYHTILVTTVLLPGILFWTHWVKLETILQDKFWTRFKDIFDELKLTSKSKLFNTSIYVFRRLIFVMIALYMSVPTVQILLFLMMNYVSILYHLK